MLGQNQRNIMAARPLKEVFTLAGKLEMSIRDALDTIAEGIDHIISLLIPI